METWQFREGTVESSGEESVAECRIELSVEAKHRALIAERVRAFWDAIQRGQLQEYLDPLPQTRLHAAQRAFHEVGARRIANILRSGLFKLTRPGTPVSLTILAAELTAAIRASNEGIPDLVDRYAKSPIPKVVPRLSAFQSWRNQQRPC